MKLAVTLALLASSFALAQPMPPPNPPMPGHGMMGGGAHMGFGSPELRGIPPQVAQKLQIPNETVKKIDDTLFEANQKLISLDADLRRAQLDLEHALKDDKPNDAQIMKLADKVGAAETGVRKNRLQLMLDVRKTLGPDLWKKVQAEYGEVRELRRMKIMKKWKGGGGWDDEDDDDFGPPQKDQKPPPPAKKP